MKKQLTYLFLLFSVVLHAEGKVAVLQTAQARFTQTRTSSLLEEPIVQTGFFAYVAPDSITWIYDGQQNAMIPEPMLAFIKQAVSGDVLTAKSTFDVQWEAETLVLTPLKKQIKRFFTSIRIRFDNDGVATDLLLEEPNLDQTQIVFTNMKYSIL